VTNVSEEAYVLKIEAIVVCEMFVSTYELTRHQIPEEKNI
jgi:hypothetical protein